MLDKEIQNVFTEILNIGEHMLRAGGEVYRVEDTISRLICAYGGKKPHVFAIPSNIIVTATFEGNEITHTRRVPSAEINFEILDRMNDLARRVCHEKPNAGELKQMVENALTLKKYGHAGKMFIYALVSFSFAMFFGGSFADAAVSAVIGVLLYPATQMINSQRSVQGNIIFIDILCAAISAFFACLAVRVGIAHDADKIIIGNVMLLIPGVELVNGMRDFIAGDIQAGMMHVFEALFLAICIAIGAAGVLTLMGVIL